LPSVCASLCPPPFNRYVPLEDSHPRSDVLQARGTPEFRVFYSVYFNAGSVKSMNVHSLARLDGTSNGSVSDSAFQFAQSGPML
jgi:hypothetical protein